MCDESERIINWRAFHANARHLHLALTAVRYAIAQGTFRSGVGWRKSMVNNSFRLNRTQKARHITAIGVCMTMAFGPSASFADAGADASRQELVVASVAFNFARFIQWGETDATASAQSLVFCILDDGPSPAWRQLEGKTVGQRRIELEYVRAAEPSERKCDMAYVSKNSMESLSLKEMAESGVVTISDAKRFAKEGGAIELAVSDKGATFDVNQRSLSRAGARISSKLMRVGMRVSLSGD
ncbi:MAG: YfiR family protein [Pseudomonadota bacterium]